MSVVFVGFLENTLSLVTFLYQQHKPETIISVWLTYDVLNSWLRKALNASLENDALFVTACQNISDVKSSGCLLDLRNYPQN